MAQDTPERAVREALAPDPVIEVYKTHVDRSLLRETLTLTPDQRLRRLQRFVEDLETLRAATARR